MKKLFIIIILSIFIFSCKSNKINEKIEYRIYNYHLGIVENFYKYGYYDNGECLEKSITFLEKITNIKCDITEQYVMMYIPSAKNIKDWKKWFSINKENLFWDENKNVLSIQALQ